MDVAKAVLDAQNVKEMTRRAIKVILAIDPMDPVGMELVEDFKKEYGESV